LLALDDLAQRVSDAGQTAVHGRMAMREGKAFPYISEVIEQRGRNSFRVHHDRILARVDDLLAFVEPETMEARMLVEVKSRMANGPTALKWLDECEQRFDRLLARACRQRNAVTHGTRTISEVVSSIEPFLDRIAGRAIGALQRSVEDRQELSVQLETWKVSREKSKALLSAGGDPAQLFV
jgi:hypothetical protein